MSKRRKLPTYVDKRFRTKKAALAYQRKVDRAGRVATAPYKTRGGYIVRSTRHKVFRKNPGTTGRPYWETGLHQFHIRSPQGSNLRYVEGNLETALDEAHRQLRKFRIYSYVVLWTRRGDYIQEVHRPRKNRGKKIRKNRGKRLSDADMEELMRDPQFKKALRLYRKIHGCDPESISRVILPIGGKRVTGREFFASMGRAPAESYEPYQKGSRKKGKIWVHPYDNKPEKVVSADGKTIITLPGSHGVRDIDGEAWIDG